MCDGNELMRDETQNTIQKNEETVQIEEKRKSEKEIQGTGSDRRRKKRGTNPFGWLKDAPVAEDVHARTQKKFTHARPHTRSGGRSGSGEMSFTGTRSVEPSTRTGVELWPTNEGKKKGTNPTTAGTVGWWRQTSLAAAAEGTAGFLPP